VDSVGNRDAGVKQAGRGLVISGIVLMALSVLGVAVTVAVVGRGLDLNEFGRDVAINGQLDSDVPGQIGFRIIESLSSDEDSMSVGVAVSSASTDIDCEIVDVRADPVPLRRGSSTDTFVSPDINSSWTVAVVAEDLEPGEYSARCEVSGEPSAAGSPQFTVGRILTTSEVFDLFGPAIGILVAIVLGGLLGLVGLILLIVGLVRRSRAKKSPPSQGHPQPGPPQQGWPQQGWPQHGGPGHGGPPPGGGTQPGPWVPPKPWGDSPPASPPAGPPPAQPPPAQSPPAEQPPAPPRPPWDPPPPD
jgi:hypothetical protein